MTRRLRLVLGDQLTLDVAALRDLDIERDVVLMAEVVEEATYVRHHKKKIAFVLAAMRAFAREIEGRGARVRYVRLDDPANTGSLVGELDRAAADLNPDAIVLTEPGEHRLAAAFEAWAGTCSALVEIREDGRFVCSRAGFRSWAAGRRQLRMEFFYRRMRSETGLLMDGEKPVGGRWNYDAENRKAASSDLFMPRPRRFAPTEETRAVLDLVAARFPDHFGDLEPFWFGVTRAEAEESLEHFLETSLPRFGDTQDAMLRDEPFLHHAVISLYLNVGLLDPLDVCRRAEARFRSGRAPISSVEGFIRQILGWREFVRGVYWLEGPEYVRANALGADRPLPWFYWTGETDMACLAACISQTKREAYAHHIQRLMVTGNFALLAGVDPFEVHDWYLAVYADAFEWVEAPNTVGMSQFGDGGVVASKPYVSSGAYIDRMSDYCGGCAYDVKAKTGSGACPFNYLYWDFLVRHRDRFAGNPRMGPMYKTLDRMTEGQRAAIAESAAAFLARLA